MHITAIKQQVKRADRYSIYVDEKYSFSLSDTALLESRLVPGQELTPAEVKDLKRQSADDKVYSLALRYVAIRSRSRHELETYLKRKEAPTELIDRIMGRLSDLGFVDDEAFARVWVENRRLLKPVSRRRLMLELRQKRVPDDVVQIVLADDETSDRDTLAELVQRKRRQTKYQDDTKLMQYLARQGYGYDDIKSALADDGSD
ncbi:MAG TPA: RecX family transcriptional regulator [Candidatus Limnocylindrales bacterium]|nr:RecX family transcriptional regulator [Candidatus Limnocylindrales bacterium]